ncbi:phosphatidate cytidylyltransferase [Geomicrobium sediminis]|uniref:Phosphatidate cytidylyltransferase n=1 Tax=Geomicrobium sediminis TaxID=1347788 RepID=A0ABS2PBG6_9BACL|nr:phosphatidate cytidylyltransferase [Geomicrobium sediminis]MBM7632622.1 phosphatidate cytidylyltransferase [Geomicrobium sediminis]
MKLRVLTAVVGLVVLLIPLIVGGPLFLALVAAMTVVGFFELLRMNKIPILSIPAALGVSAALVLLLTGPNLERFSNEATLAWLIVIFMLLLLTTFLSNNRYHFGAVAFVAFSALYVGIGFHFFYAARIEFGLPYIFFVLLAIWATDTGAYLFGKKFGKTKLSPHISPNKTIEGATGGLLLALIVGVVYSLFLPPYESLFVTIVALIVISVAGQCGDLVESAFKRYYDVKDSGRILPGHGGVLDRFDSLLFVFPLLYVVSVILGG